MGASKRSRMQYIVIILIALLFGSCIFWYFEIQTFLGTQSLESSTYILPQLIPLSNQTENITSLIQQIKSLQTNNTILKHLNTQITNEKMKLKHAISNSDQNTNNVTDFLWTEIDKLNQQIWDLKDSSKQHNIKNYELQQQIKSLKVNKSNIHNINHYLLFGFCNDKTKYNKQVIVIMNSIKNYISKTYKDWIVLNISIRSFLISMNFSYTHGKLLTFTELTIPNINIKHDKFQWIFEPHCREFYNDLKSYYNNKSIHISLPIDIYEYYNVSKTNNYGYIDDNDRYKNNIKMGLYDHIVNINHYKYNNTYLNISDKIRILNVWQNDSYYSFNSEDNFYPLSLKNNRPFLMECSGEVFDAWIIHRKHPCYSIDFHMQRTNSWVRRGCIVGLFIQGIIQRDVIYNKYRKHQRYEDLMNYNKLITNKFNNNELYIDEIIKHKKRFCSFTVKTFFMWGSYFSDALIRHVIHYMISKQYKYCDMLGFHYEKYNRNLLCSDKNIKYIGTAAYTMHHLLVECQKEFKFSINMENMGSYGYTSEKIYTGLIANTIPIYFGNKNIHKIINIDRIIFCDINDNILFHKRKEYKQFYRHLKKEYDDFQINKTAADIVIKIVLNWAVDNYGMYLQSCVDEVIEVDKNDSLYRWKLSQPMIPKNTFSNSHYDGTIISKSFIDALKFLQSPLFE
eukprot:29262_1